MKFHGSPEQLEGLVARTGIAGKWVDVQDGRQFRTREGGVLIWYSNTGTLSFRGREPASSQLAAALTAVLEEPRPAGAVEEREQPGGKRVFVVHGHDEAAREQLELVLHKLGLEPFVLANTGGGGLTLIEALEREITGPTAVRFGIVLMTPDDMGYARTAKPEQAEPRARQNVVLEMGMMISAVGRPRVAILKKGHVEVPSDAQGIIYIPFNDHVKETLPRLVDRLREAGFDLDIGAVTKASA
jgi:predicted nucleotide-binding protein